MIPITSSYLKVSSPFSHIAGGRRQLLFRDLHSLTIKQKTSLKTMDGTKELNIFGKIYFKSNNIWISNVAWLVSLKELNSLTGLQLNMLPGKHNPGGPHTMVSPETQRKEIVILRFLERTGPDSAVVIHMHPSLPEEKYYPLTVPSKKAYF